MLQYILLYILLFWFSCQLWVCAIGLKFHNELIAYLTDVMRNDMTWDKQKGCLFDMQATKTHTSLHTHADWSVFLFTHIICPKESPG